MTGTPREVRIDLSGSDIAGLDFGGQGPLVLLLHGGGRTAADWLPVAHLLAPHRAVAIDFRGHGLSSATEVTVERCVSDVTAVARELAPDGVFLVGHSLGGIVATMAAATNEWLGVMNVDGFGVGHPSLIDGYDVERAETELARLFEKSLASMREHADTGGEEWMKVEVERDAAMIARLGVEKSLADRIARRCFRPVGYGRIRRSPSNEALASMLRSLQGLDLGSYYERITSPLCIVRAHLDAQMLDDPDFGDLLKAYSRGIVKQLSAIERDHPNIEVEQVETGHMVHFEAPDYLAGRIKAFVTS